MLLLEQLLPPVALAGAVAAIGSLLALREKRNPIRAAAGVLAAAYAAGHFSIAAPTSFPPADSVQWLPYFALAGTAAACSARWIPTRAARLAALGLFSAAALRLLLAPKFRHAWSAEQGWLWVVGLSALALLSATGLTLAGRSSSRPAELPLLMLFLATGTAAALALSGSLLLGQFAGILAAALLGAFPLLRRGEGRLDEAAAVFSLLHLCLLAGGHVFSGLPAPGAVPLALAPLAVAASGWLVKESSSSRAAPAARWLAAAGCVGLALHAALRSSPPWI